MKRFVLMLFTTAAVATSIVFLVRPTTQASPDVTITVNSTLDTNVRDSVMTLREAMLLATGGLAVTDLSQGECAHVSGAYWDVWCFSPVQIGTGAETVVFDPADFPPGSPGTISLNFTLPTLSTGNDTIDGSSAGVIVDGRGVGFDCFTITSDTNIIKGLQIYNCYTAITIIWDAQYNTIGGTTSGERNVISGNDVLGVLITGSDDNVVEGNYIGTNASASAALPNGEEGVVITGGAQGNTIRNNVISGNTRSGVHIDGGARSNIVKGNYIGTNANGTNAIANDVGVYIHEGAQSNTVGGSSPGDRNVISGNLQEGVFISDSGTTGNVAKGNYIGTNATGTGSLPNGSCGVRVFDGAQNNTIGGTTGGERNVISGHSSYRDAGVCITGANTVGNTVRGNFIGTDAAGTAALNNYFGVRISDADDNVIGGSAPGEGNVISGNNAAGIWIQSADHNTVKGNFIGTDASGTAALANYDGVLIEEGSRSNTIGGTMASEGNVIAYNTGRGVWVRSPGAIRNTIRGNSIHSNGDMGIVNSNGGNTELTPPTITSVGSVVGTACANCTIDIYSDDEDEGRVYEGSTTADGAGNWSFAGSLEGPNITATATDSNGNTSEFSAPVAAPQLTPTPSPTPSPTPTPTPSVTATPTPAGPTRTLVWGSGWQNATWSGASTPEDAFACAAGKYAAAYRFVEGGLERYFPDRPDISNMTNLEQYAAFLILITQPVTCTMPVAAASGSSRTLQWGVGWHNEGWSGADGMAPQGAFACADGSYAAAYRLVNGNWERYFPGRPDISNMVPLSKYDAFLILVTAPVNCTMPIAP
jgi:parallel beta-helix repeat protein